MATMAKPTFDLDELCIKSFDTVECTLSGHADSRVPEAREEASMCCGETNQPCGNVWAVVLPPGCEDTWVTTE